MGERMTSTRMPKMTKDDLRDLRSYFGGGGFNLLEQSPLGHQLDALRRYGGSRRCAVCGGLGVVPLDRGAESRAASCASRRRQVAAWGISLVAERATKVPKADLPHLTEYRRLRDEDQDRTGAEKYRRAHAEEIRQECDRESGARAREQEKWIRGEAQRLAQEERDGVTERGCLECRGTGWTGEQLRHRVTARPTCTDGSGHIVRGADTLTALDVRETGSSKHGEGGYDPGDVVLFTVGRIARRIARVQLVEPRLALALARYYAPQSGGALALWDLVPAGMTLLKQRSEPMTDATPAQVFAAISDEARKHPDPRRDAQIATARDQAHDLARRAHEAWADSETPAVRREVLPGVPKRPRIRAPKSAALEALAGAVRLALVAGLGAE
jgi:hypothetical protein